MFFSPRGKRLVTGLHQVRDRAPLLGGSLALWCGSFAATSGMLKYYRGGIEDEWNDTIGGALTTFMINIRSGGFYYAGNQAI